MIRGREAGGAAASVGLCAAALLCLLVACAGGRARAAGQVETIAVSLRVSNNLATALELSVTGEPGVAWSGRVDARATLEAQIGTMPVGTPITLRAVNPSQLTVSLRSNVRARAGVLIWTIP